MSKKCKKGDASVSSRISRSEKNNTKPVSDSKLGAVIGSSNVARWTQIKNDANCKSNEGFVKVLLDLAAIYLIKDVNSKCAIKQGNHDNTDGDNDSKQRLEQSTTKEPENEDVNHNNHSNKKKKEHKHKKRKHSIPDVKVSQHSKTTTPKLIQSVNNVKHVIEAQNSLESKSPTDNRLKQGKVAKPCIMVNISNDLLVPLQVPQPQTVTKLISQPSKVLLIENIVKTDMKELPNLTKQGEFEDEVKEKDKLEKSGKPKQVKLTESEQDVRKAPELLPPEQETKQNIELVHQGNALTMSASTALLNVKYGTENANLCLCCETGHFPNDQCHMMNPKVFITDALTLTSWQDSQQSTQLNKQEGDIRKNTAIGESYAIKSFPCGLKLDDITQPGCESQQGVFATQIFDAFTQFGPLVAPTIKEVDVPEDCTMKYMFEIIKGETERVYFNAENEAVSNWIRYLRPAPSRELRNMLVMHKGDCLYFVTSRTVARGEELLYWQDDISSNKKKMEKTTCGGCNMTFQHPLHYRIHCSVFHDVRYSLTIRKYHCKVCGAAVLGKENIMKHASELHNGQGAYQCQFCKKFFLRLNYLEMHRTYGCSANPHRSRPLCDFCGRKFCQPQKLKVHIKRMHSDMSEVLKEFQCKNCMKILGSRAALQRHFKEVHQKQMDGACACSKCGKTFQNKSNLKIHMLTHSGIKPFRCNQSNCGAAFTTKQCLQFHYKKVHGYTEDMMPKIERSVDYTFEAYSGNGDEDISTEAILNSFESKTETENNATAPTADGAIAAAVNNTPEKLISSGVDPVVNQNEQVDDVIDKVNPPALRSPPPLRQIDQSSNSAPSPPILEAYAPNMKILTKGSKKWIGEQSDVYVDQRKLDFAPQIGVSSMQHLQQDEQPDEHQPTAPSYDKPVVTSTYESSTGKILGYNRHESNASLLVEAALDSVCSEPNIDIDVATTTCTDTLVNNLYTLPNVNVHVHDVHDNDSLADVTYSQSVDVTDSRDINLISPSVNEQISVTDDIDELHHGQSIGIDYSSFHQEDFSPPNSPRNFRDYIQSSPATQQAMQPTQHNHVQHNHVYEKQISPGGVASPPRYDFGSAVVNPESDDSNHGIGVQNLSLHAEKFPDVATSRDGIQLDLSIYKSHYAFDSSFLRKEAKRFEIIDVTDHDDHGHKNYLIDNEDTNKFSLNGNVDNENLDSELKDFEGMEDADVEADVDGDGKSVKDLDLSMRSAVTAPDLRSKFDLDLDLRKSYDMDGELRRTYNDSLDDFRMKNYDLDNLDALRSNLERKTYESLIEDFRTDRNFEPLVLNPSELQGLDMSARGYHNYPNLNRYHHLYAEVDRPTVDLRLNYSPPPPPPTYTHPDILRVTLDLAQPTRHTVDLSLRSQIANSRLLTEHTLQTSRLGLDQGRLLPGDLSVTAPRHITPDRLISDMSNRILSDHTTNRLLGNDQLGAQARLMGNDQRMLQDDRLIEQPRLLEQNRLLGNGSLSPVSYTGYSVSPSPYHPTALPPRPHVTSPNPTPYHHYSAYY